MAKSALASFLHYARVTLPPLPHVRAQCTEILDLIHCVQKFSHEIFFEKIPTEMFSGHIF